jgi:hypothetical protein
MHEAAVVGGMAADEIAGLRLGVDQCRFDFEARIGIRGPLIWRCRKSLNGSG